MAATTMSVRPRLKQRYDTVLRTQLLEELGLGNIMDCLLYTSRCV